MFIHIINHQSPKLLRNLRFDVCVNKIILDSTLYRSVDLLCQSEFINLLMNHSGPSSRRGLDQILEVHVIICFEFSLCVQRNGKSTFDLFDIIVNSDRVKYLFRNIFTKFPDELFFWGKCSISTHSVI